MLPQGWSSIPQMVPPKDTQVGDPVTRIVVASAPISFGTGCNVATYVFPSTAVALVVVEWVRLSKTARWPARPHRFTATTLPVQAPPAIECFAGAGGSVQFADHGRHFGAYLLLGRNASPTLADRARGVLDTLRVAAAPPYIMVSGPRLAKPVPSPTGRREPGPPPGGGRVPSPKGERAPRAEHQAAARPGVFWGWSLDSPPQNESERRQRARLLLPTYRGRPALIRMKVNGEDHVHVASPKVLRIFAKHGIPTRM